MHSLWVSDGPCSCHGRVNAHQSPWERLPAGLRTSWAPLGAPRHRPPLEAHPHLTEGRALLAGMPPGLLACTQAQWEVAEGIAVLQWLCCAGDGLPGTLIQELLLGCLLPRLQGSLHRQALSGVQQAGTLSRCRSAYDTYQSRHDVERAWMDVDHMLSDTPQTHSESAHWSNCSSVCWTLTDVLQHKACAPHKSGSQVSLLLMSKLTVAACSAAAIWVPELGVQQVVP